ncbi:NAD(P)/FAD-dependent oxidoreductase [Egicoccus sp. AB-alg2]|uniref:NAD(P)/FAD-dependent oxidoreductase n=1 Tax=Egicoccus sp. AB-alg2 TaxID=3242693 RepID=UPI00359EA3ED
MKTELDVAIIGGGAGGLSAALVLCRARRRVAVIDAGQPRNAPAAHLHGFLTRDGTSPADLIDRGRQEVASYGGHLIDARVLDIDAGDESFRLRLSDDAELSARRLLFATGLTDRLPDVEGIEARWGHDVLHCPYCHGYEIADQPLGVLNAGPTAVEQAATIRNWSTDVTLFTNGSRLEAQERATLTAIGIEAVTTRVDRLVITDDALAGLRLANGTLVTRTALFVAMTPIPNDTLLRHLGAATRDHPMGKFVSTDEQGRTSISGTWAIGNVVDPRAQLITAAGDGSRAAISINTDLIAEDIRLAAATH